MGSFVTSTGFPKRIWQNSDMSHITTYEPIMGYESFETKNAGYTPVELYAISTGGQKRYTFRFNLNNVNRIGD